MLLYNAINGIISEYPSFKIVEGKSPVNYLQDKVKDYIEFRKTVKETELQAVIDDILEFLNQIIYKLKNLK
jgi:hypothetical protein